MELYRAALASSITPLTSAAIIGAFIGAWISSDVKEYGWRLTILLTILTLAGAGALSEYIYYKWSALTPFVHFMFGGVFGMFGLRLLDAMRLISEPFTKKLVDIASNSLLNNLGKLGKKLASLIGL